MRTSASVAVAAAAVMVIAAVGATRSDASEEVVSPLRIAQCRSRCLQKFSSPQQKKTSCLQSPDCFMCWENCELLQANFQIWGSICQTEICYPGCQEACRFHRETPQEKQAEPVIKARGEELLRIEDNVAKWPSPTSSSAVKSPPVVYVVMRRNADSTWSQISQTVDRSLPLSENTITSNLRVLVVNPDGLVTMYSPSAPQQQPTSSSPERINESVVNRIMAGVNSRRGDKISINTPKSNSWALREVSLIHQKVLVLAEVSWEPRLRRAVYLVTWEVDGGGLKGNLFTDSTCVTLSLWPDTIYHIQVEVVGKTDRSLPLVLDTRKASQVSFDIPKTSETPLVFTDKTRHRLVLNDQTRSTEMTAEITKALDESLGARRTYNPRKIFKLDEAYDKSSLSSVVPAVGGVRRSELVLGSAAALILFLVICLLVVFRSRRKTLDAAPDPDYLDQERRRVAFDSNIVLVTRTEDLKPSSSETQHTSSSPLPSSSSSSSSSKDIRSWRSHNFLNDLLTKKKISESLPSSSSPSTSTDFLKAAEERATSEVQV